MSNQPTPRQLHETLVKQGNAFSVKCGCGTHTFHTNSLLLCPSCWEDPKKLDVEPGHYL